jgi:endonuclease/exonuclease/phosphatase family metal-dependent hydrolase
VTLRVLSYNIQHGGQGRLPAILDVIGRQRPDLVALLEANSRPNAEMLADTLGMQLTYGDANSAFAVAWLSKLPVVSSQNHRLPLLAKTLLKIEVTWEGAPLHLFATHLVAGRSEEHGERRAGETRAILTSLERVAGQPHLLVGDFNACHPGDAVSDPPRGETVGYLARRPIEQILEAGYVDGYRQLHSDEPGYTYEASHPWLRIDYVFASPELAGRLRACDVVSGGDAEHASDHLPVRAELD